MYQIPAQGNIEDPGGADRIVDEIEERLKRAFKKKFRDLCGAQPGNKTQALVQIGSVEGLEKELKQVMRSVMKQKMLNILCMKIMSMEFQLHCGIGDQPCLIEDKSC